MTQVTYKIEFTQDLALAKRHWDYGLPTFSPDTLPEAVKDARMLFKLGFKDIKLVTTVTCSYTTDILEVVNAINADRDND